MGAGYTALVAAFVIGGLKEMGKPARKAFIVNLADPPSGLARSASITRSETCRSFRGDNRRNSVDAFESRATSGLSGGGRNAGRHPRSGSLKEMR